MRILLVALVGLAACATAVAEDGLVVRFTISKTTGPDTKSYTNSVLVRLTESTKVTFPGLYEMRLDARATANGDEDLVIAVKDLSSGKPVYVGSGATTLKVGASATVPLHALQGAQSKYAILVDTSYGALPPSAR